MIIFEVTNTVNVAGSTDLHNRYEDRSRLFQTQESARKLAKEVNGIVRQRTVDK